MRIAVWHNLPSGGGKRALYDHVRGLVGRGHHVEVWCPACADPDFLPLRDLGRERVLPWHPKPARPRMFPKYRTYSLQVHAELAAMSDHCRAAAAEIDAGGFDVVLANPCQIFRAVPLARHLRTPAVLYLQEPNRALFEAAAEPPFVGVRPPGRSVLAPWYVRARLGDFFPTDARRAMVRAEFESVRAFDRVLVNSYFSRESVLRAYGTDATVCYLGIDADHFAAADDAPRTDTVVGVGAFMPAKNIDFVVRAVGAIPAPRPRLVWAGNMVDEAYLARLTALAGELGVTFEPRVKATDAEVVGALRTAAVMAYAPRLEPFGYAPLEANACGTPVVAVAEGGVRETVRDGENGLLVDPTPAAMAAGIDRLRRDPGLTRRLGQRGREVVRTAWSLTAATDRLEANLKQVAAAGRRAA